MARIQGISTRQAGLYVKLAYFFTYHIALKNIRGRFNLALGIGSAGFSEGMVCAIATEISGEAQLDS